MARGNNFISFFVTNVNADGLGRLQVRLRYEGATSSANLGYMVVADKWDARAQRCVNNSTHYRKGIKVSASEVNSVIRRSEESLQAMLDEAFKDGRTPSVAEFKAAALGRVDSTGGRIGGTPLSVAFGDFMAKQSILAGWSDNSIRKYNTLLKILKEWDKDLRLERLDSDKLADYLTFLQERGYKDRTTHKMIVNFKTFLKWADKAGYAVPPAYKDFNPRVRVVGKSIVWLSLDEVSKLCDLDLSRMRGKRGPDNRLRTVRDVFCFACLTGLRYSDIMKLHPSDIQGGQVCVTIEKTGERVRVELNKRASAILSRNMDKDRETCFPYIANVTLNEKIKEICKFAGIDQPTTEVWYEGGRRKERTREKYLSVTMHTGRRSFVCNALSLGISPSVVMKWTGHKSYTEMLPYIDISDTAKANAMKLFDI